MQKRVFILLLSLLAIQLNSTFAQISQGGEPLPPMSLRSANTALFVEMESIDTKALLEEDATASGLRRSVRFAHKFHTNLNPENSGIRFTLANGTKVWQCGIRSVGAYSINLLFSEYRVPKGAKLFIYNKSRTHKIGAFTDYNNSSYNKLPTAPVFGDEIIVEYQEPANVEFKGQIVIGEVNHDYKGVTLRAKPGNLHSTETCHQESACFPEYDNQAQAVTLLIIDGNEYCTGCLVNNTENDKTPYLLSAAHCFLPRGGVSSETRATNTIIFFNYQNPSCNTAIIGTEEMSMASADLLVNNTKTDVALLRLKELPPRHYRPYFAGWNASTPASSPYFCIHHPMSSTKKTVISDKKITLKTYADGNYPTIDSNIHWEVGKWANGTTEGGSSGAPLFDSNKRIVGALTGGSSNCSSPSGDNFYALQKIWTKYPEDNNQLKKWLDPKNRGILRINGLNPYSDSMGVRLSNIAKNEKIGVSYLESPQIGPLFGNNSLQVSEFGERFITGRRTTIYGVHLVTPVWKSSWNDKIELSIYSGYSKPDILLNTETIQLKYSSYINGAFTELTKPNNLASDNFILFNTPIVTDYSFFITLKLDYSQTTDTFKIYNVLERPVSRNTVFLNTFNTGWKMLSDTIQNYPLSILNTSLWIDPEVYLGTESPKPAEDIFTGSEIIYYVRNQRILYFKNLSPTNNYYLRIYSYLGKVLIEKTMNLTESYFSLNIDTPLPNGVYIIELRNNTKIIRRKVSIFNDWPSNNF